MIYQVGTGKQFSTPAEAFKSPLIIDGDTIEIAAGVYKQDAAFAAVTKALTIRGVGGRAILDGAFITPTAYNGQAITPLDTQGKLTIFENIEWINGTGSPGNVAGCKINPNSNAKFVNCAFRNCQNGILSSAGAHTLEFVGCEWDSCGTGTGKEHNIYDGGSAHLILRNCWSHDSIGGQLVKTRATKTTIEYCRLDGRSNYHIDPSYGGEVLVVGSLLRQVGIGATTDNKAMISFGREGNLKPSNFLRMVHCTVINEQATARFIACNADPSIVVEVANCILQSGPGWVESDAVTYSTPGTVRAAAGLVDAAYKIVAGSAAIGAAVPNAIVPDRQYLNLGTEPRLTVVDAGAYQAGAELPPPTPTEAITWAIASGSLPTGLALSAEGVISGMPSKAGSFTFSVQASKTGATPAVKQFTVAITDPAPTAPAVVIATTSLPSGVVGAAYSATLAALVQ